MSRNTLQRYPYEEVPKEGMFLQQEVPRGKWHPYNMIVSVRELKFI
jgi:hypothetical protein